MTSDDLPLDQITSTPIGETYNFCPMCRTELIYNELFDRLRQQCPKCGWIHFQDPKVGAGVLAEKEGRVLLGRRGVNPGLGLWCFPSGFMEIDESPEQAAIREFKEETGLEVELTGLFDIFHFFSNTKGTGVLILYQGNILNGIPTAMDDLAELAFFHPDELPPDDELAFDSNRIALKRWREAKRQE